jgi:GNAT superfamily N-acetyltransferase
MEFRSADPDESDVLGRMTLAGVRHWGHDENFPEAVEGLRQNGLPTPDFVTANLVEVLVDQDERVGFYSLATHDDHVELVHMFVDVDRIGSGVGRRLWHRAVSRASSLADRMLIMSDPSAKEFYSAMGARLERDVEVSPGFFLGQMWYDLSGDAGREIDERTTTATQVTRRTDGSSQSQRVR